MAKTTFNLLSSSLLLLSGCSGTQVGERIRHSPQWRDGKFHNAQPMRNEFLLGLRNWWNASPEATPKDPLPVQEVDSARFHTPPRTGLRVTWLGHSTSLVEMDGIRVLIDPVWGPRASLVSWAGPKRWYPPPLDLQGLPELDAVLISHDHFDHLDEGTIRKLGNRTDRFIVPLGVGKRLLAWGIDSGRIEELDWWDSLMVREIRVVSTPARHASGRSLFDRDRSLWCGFALSGPTRSLYYSGDTGPQEAFAEIGRRLGPFDLTLLECGQYDPAWPDWHMAPESTLSAHRAVDGKVLMPVHWGLFKLAFHSWKEPIERLLQANADSLSTIVVPRPGGSFEPPEEQPHDPWWEPLR
ncbi:MAG: MBL fold metallo-hydrolase [Fibrobacteria bacterium]|nr:MBL fold metallo-hydrolase [Fibrobacteria bacterium]